VSARTARELRKETSYQRLRRSEGGLIDANIELHEFLSNVEARLTVVRAHLQKGQVKAAKRKVSRLLGDMAEKLTPSEEVPF
jgi:hypothetical protein